MRLSEAMRLGSMMKPQGYYNLCRAGATCALGAVGDAIGILDADNCNWKPGAKAPSEWRWMTRLTACPACGATDYPVPTSFSTKRRDVQAAITHLNNEHRWTREQIADWIETIEPKEQSTVVENSTVQDAVACPVLVQAD